KKMKLRALLCVGAISLLPSFAFAAACPGTQWNPPFPGTNTVAGDTCASTNSIATMCGGGIDSPGNDDAYQFTGTGAGVNLTITPTGTAWDVAAQVMTGACGSGTCLSGGGGADANGAGGAENITFTQVAATTYWLIIYSGQLTANCGTYTISGTLPVKLEKF